MVAYPATSRSRDVAQRLQDPVFPFIPAISLQLLAARLSEDRMHWYGVAEKMI
jgi:hypothetical protein